MSGGGAFDSVVPTAASSPVRGDRDGSANRRGSGRKTTPLHLAASAGHVGAVRDLIDAGANVAARDSEGLMPLHRAASAGCMEVLRVLLNTPAARQRGDIEARREALTRGSRRGSAAAGEPYPTPLQLTACGGHLKAVLVLLEAGADPNAWDDNDQTVLQYARESSQNGQAIVEELVRFGAKPGPSDAPAQTKELGYGLLSMGKGMAGQKGVGR